MIPIHDITEARIVHDGTVSIPRLLHPEGIAIAADGAIWCGGELGHLYRISPDGKTLEERACTGGFILGVAFDAAGRLYACDLAHRTVYRYTPDTNELAPFATGRPDRPLGVPNGPVVDTARNALYVSESANPGPGIWRFDLDTGEGDLWVRDDLAFANGMALTVAETFGRRITRFPINADGSAGEPELVVETPGVLPDGLALATDGTLVIACYEPSRILALTPDGVLETLLDDPEAHTLCHPTNTAFRGSELLIANLGRWHVTALATNLTGVPLPI
jgi:sugar lactone lactonase YvrE